jgi:hypothetical protein
MWNLLRCLSALLICCVCAATAAADGGAFKRLIEDPSAANMPDQRAILAYSNGIETLAIQTRFEGNPAEFAWVVPLPAVPKVTACSHGTFKTMPSLMARRVHANVPAIWIGVLVLVAAMVVMYHCRSRFYAALICLLLLFGGAVILMPALGKARASAVATAEPSLEVRTEEVGNYEVNILSSKSADELVGWLTDHGFDVGERAKAAIAAYAKDGWVFAASRASRSKIEAGGGTITPHALTFEFPTPVPVYPMRLTGANNTGPLEVSLYAFGTGTASAPGWTLKHSDVCELGTPHSAPDLRRSWPTSKVVVTHAGLGSVLASHADGPLHATHLARVFKPSDMDEDVVIRFGDPIKYQDQVWSPEAAFNEAANYGVAAMLVLWFIAIGVREAVPAVRTHRVWAACTGIPCLIIMTMYLSTPRSESLTSFRRDQRLAEDLYMQAYEAMEAPTVGPDVQTAVNDMQSEQVHRLVKSWLDRYGYTDESQRPRVEDSPGNYVVERADGKWVIRVIDLMGQESRIPL